MHCKNLRSILVGIREYSRGLFLLGLVPNGIQIQENWENSQEKSFWEWYLPKVFGIFGSYRDLRYALVPRS